MAVLAFIALVTFLNPAVGLVEKREDGAVAKLTELREALKTQFAAENPTRVERLIKALDSAKADLEKPATSSVDADSVKAAITGVIGALPKFKHKNPIVVATAVTDALSSVAVLVPGPYGAAISTVFSVVGGLIGLAKHTPTMAQVVEGIVKKQLDARRQKDLSDEVSGAKRELDSLHSILIAAIGNQPTETDILFVNSQAGNQLGLQILGKLESYIRRESHNVNSKAKFEAHMKLTKLYVDLTNIRTELLYMMNSLYHQSNLTRTTEEGIMGAIDSTLKIDRSLFEFYGSPDPNQAYLVASMMPSRNRVVTKYFKKLGIDMDKAQNELVAHKCGYYMYSAKEEWEQFYIADDGEDPVYPHEACGQPGDCADKRKKRGANGRATFMAIFDKNDKLPKQHGGRATIVFQKQGDGVVMTTKAAKSGHLNTRRKILQDLRIAFSERNDPTTYRLVKTNKKYKKRSKYYWMSTGQGGHKTAYMESGEWDVLNGEVAPFPNDEGLWILKSAC